MREIKSVITVSGIAVEVTEKAVRTLRLRVTRDGRVCLSVPRFTPQRIMVAFVGRNKPWIEAQLTKLAARPAPREHSYDTGETLLLWGESYPLRLRVGKRVSTELADGEVWLTVPEGSGTDERESAVLDWYRERLSEAIGQRLPLWEKATGLRCASWRIKRMKTRWGSCNTREGRIWLNLYLAQTPTDCLDYVLLHELCHLRFADHGAGFKALLDSHMPDWRQRRKLLNSYLPGVN